MSLRLEKISQQLSENNGSRLAQYRSNSKLDPKEIRKLIFENGYDYVQEVYKIFAKHKSIFTHSHLEDGDKDRQRFAGARLLIPLYKDLKIDIINELDKFLYIYYALSSYEYSQCLKGCLHFMNYTKTMITFQTNDTHKKFIERAMKMEDIGAYCLT